MAEDSVVTTEDLQRRREVIQRVVAAGVCALVLNDAIQGIVAGRRRLGRAVETWWTGVERRERSRYQKAESEFLSRLLNPR